MVRTNYRHHCHLPDRPQFSAVGIYDSPSRYWNDTSDCSLDHLWVAADSTQYLHRHRRRQQCYRRSRDRHGHDLVASIVDGGVADGIVNNHGRSQNRHRIDYRRRHIGSTNRCRRIGRLDIPRHCHVQLTFNPGRCSASSLAGHLLRFFVEIPRDKISTQRSFQTLINQHREERIV